MLRLFRQNKRDIPVIMQSEITECGLACMAMIGSHLGHDIDLQGLRMKFPASERGVTLSHLMTIADQLDLQPRPLKLDLESISELTLPAILHWNMNHYVVLVDVEKSGAYIHDPAFGRRFIRHSELSQCFTGVALELTKKANFKPQEMTKRIKMLDLTRNYSGLNEGLWKSGTLSIIILLLSILAPVLIQTLYDQVLPVKDASFLMTLCLAIILINMFKLITAYFRTQMLLYLGAMIGIVSASSIFNHLINLPMHFFQKRHLGDIESKFRANGPN